MTIARYDTHIILRSGAQLDLPRLARHEADAITDKVLGLADEFVHVDTDAGYQTIRVAEVAAVTAHRCPPMITAELRGCGYVWVCECGSSGEVKHPRASCAQDEGKQGHTCPDAEA